MILKKLCLLAVSLGCCTAIAMDNTFKESTSKNATYQGLPCDMKKLLLIKTFEGEPLATTLKAIGSHRTVSKEWLAYLSDEHVLAKAISGTTFVKENEFSPIAYTYFTQYMAQILTKETLSDLEKELRASACKEGGVSLTELFNIICEHGVAHLKQNGPDLKFLTCYWALLYNNFVEYWETPKQCLAFALNNAIERLSWPEKGELDEIASQAEQVLNTLIKDNKVTSEILTAFKGLRLILQGVELSIAGASQSALSYKHITSILRGMELQELLGSSSEDFVKELQTNYDFREQDKAYLETAVNGNQDTLRLKRELPPILVDLMIATALKAGNTKLVEKIIMKNHGSRPIDALLLIVVNCTLAVRHLDNITSFAQYYKKSLGQELCNDFGMSIFCLAYLTVSSQDELEKTLTIVENLWQPHFTIHRPWAHALYNNDLVYIQTVLDQDELIEPMKGMMLAASIIIGIQTKKYDILKMALEKIGSKQLARALVRSQENRIDFADKQLKELLAPYIN